MKITIKNTNKNMQCIFYSNSDFKNLFGYSNLHKSINYDSFVNKTMTFNSFNEAGFLDNSPINPYTTQGIKENGVNWKTSVFGSKVISWNFKNVFNVSDGNIYGISPSNFLSSLILEDKDLIRIEVETDQLFYQDFFATDNCSVESGVLEFETAVGGEVYWNAKPYDVTKYFLGFENETIPFVFDPDKILLNQTNYPFKAQLLTGDRQFPSIKIGGNDTGTWSYTKIENETSGLFFELNNLQNDNYLIVNSELQTVVNEFGDDRISSFSGDWIVIENGVTNLIWSNGDNYLEDSKYLPLNFSINLKLERKVNSIQWSGGNCGI